MREPNDNSTDRPLRVGSLFSGYGGLDLAVEGVFDARTVWFSEINEPVARVFAHHWPDAPNLGDITAIAVEALQPEWVVIENVRGCCPHQLAVQPWKETTMNDATPNPQPPAPQPFAVWNPTRGVWETSQPDLYGRLEPYSETWPASGMTHDGSAYPLPQSAHRIPRSAFSSSPIALFRTPLASDAARGGESLDQVKARRGTIALSHQVIDLVTKYRRRTPEATFALIEEFFDVGDATPQPSPDGNASPDDPPQPRHPE